MYEHMVPFAPTFLVLYCSFTSVKIQINDKTNYKSQFLTGSIYTEIWDGPKDFAMDFKRGS